MKKLILVAACFGLLASCGSGINISGDAVVKDKNDVVVGYLSSAILTHAVSDGYGSYMVMQDLKGNFVSLNLASGKLVRDSFVFFSTKDCGGSVYTDNVQVGYLYKTYPFMTDSSKTAVNATAAEKVYEVTSVAAGTETIKSFLVIDTVYNATTNPYNADDTSTYKYKCVSIATLLADAVTAVEATKLGKCTNSGQVTCRDTQNITYWTSGGGAYQFCSNPSNLCGGQPGSFTAYADQTGVPLTAETYDKSWGVLTEVSAQDITDKKVIVDYSEVAPLTESLSD